MDQISLTIPSDRSFPYAVYLAKREAEGTQVEVRWDGANALVLVGAREEAESIKRKVANTLKI